MAKPRESTRLSAATSQPGRTAQSALDPVSVHAVVDVAEIDAAEQVNDHPLATQNSLHEIQAEQAADLAAMLRLQDFSTRLLGTAELPQVLRQVLDATIELQQADFGCVQIYNRGLHKLEIVAHRGFDVTLLDRIGNIE